jgi:Domain of unknown function (DUF1906)
MAGFAGFDTDVYPGDAVMAWLLANTNLVWCAYDLGGAPSHDNASWMGKQAALTAAGWGIAPVYLGQQVIGPGSHNPSQAQGAIDGAQAAAMMASEEFPAGACVYLDIENGPPLTPEQQQYVPAWCAAVQAGGYLPGVYCSHALADNVAALAPGCRIWAFRVPTTDPGPVAAPFLAPDPGGCGYAAAHAWQLVQNGILTLQAGTLQADLSSALTNNPGAA